MPNIQGAMALLASVGAAISGAPASPASAPIHLVAEPVSSGVRLKVIGSSNAALEAKYALEVTGDAEGGSNRSVQKGEVRLLPGIPVTLITLTLGSPKAGRWTARLVVEPRGGASYSEAIGSETGTVRSED